MLILHYNKLQRSWEVKEAVITHVLLHCQCIQFCGYFCRNKMYSKWMQVGVSHRSVRGICEIWESLTLQFRPSYPKSVVNPDHQHDSSGPGPFNLLYCFRGKRVARSRKKIDLIKSENWILMKIVCTRANMTVYVSVLPLPEYLMPWLTKFPGLLFGHIMICKTCI